MSARHSHPSLPVSRTVDLLAQAETFLRARGIATARLDAEVLLAHALGATRVGVYTRLTTPLSSLQCEQFWRLVHRRAQREPLPYITRVQEFWSLEFTVTPEVLIPRPETELLVETGLQLLSRLQLSSGPRSLRILDIGTGSGCIAIALAKELPNAELWAVDLSSAALTVAQSNAQRHEVADRMHFRHSDLFSALSPANEQFDLIVSNPPYIARPDLSMLQPEVRDWEPRAALDGGDDGLALYRRFIQEAPPYLKPDGVLIMELGAGQYTDVLLLLRQQRGFHTSGSIQDYAGHERVIVAYKGAFRIS